MNNSLPRLIDGMVATLKKEIIPHIEGEFARGQAYGVIYMLNSIKLRASWSNEFLVERLQALEEASRSFEALASQLQDAPLLDVRAPSDIPNAAELQESSEAGDRRLCDLIDWLAARRTSLTAETRRRADAVIDQYLARQTKYELSTSAKPMFVEMSGGAEKSG